MNTALIAIKKLLSNENGNYTFIFSLKTVTFIGKRFCILICNHTCDVLCILSYCEIIKSHQNTFMSGKGIMVARKGSKQ